mgnify:CR=1 FL=1
MRMLLAILLSLLAVSPQVLGSDGAISSYEEEMRAWRQARHDRAARMVELLDGLGIRVTPDSLAAANILSTSASVGARGISQITCLPAFNASMVIAA